MTVNGVKAIGLEVLADMMEASSGDVEVIEIPSVGSIYKIKNNEEVISILSSPTSEQAYILI